MQGRVDYRAGVVRVDDRSWPFDLDLQKGAASVAFGETLFAVRPLLWREKVALARFAHLGLTFVQGQFLRLCLAGLMPPRDEAAVVALSALALWVNAPDESQPGLPLDPELLGTVALTLCRAAGLRPADLDERPAAEVELIWQAIARTDQTLAANRPSEDDTRQVRILVLPDPPPLAPTAATHSAQPARSQGASAEVPGATKELDGPKPPVADWPAQPAAPGSEKTTSSTEQVSAPIGERSLATEELLPTSSSAASGALPTTQLAPATPVEGQQNAAPLPPQPPTGEQPAKPALRTGFTGRFRIAYPTAESRVAPSTVRNDPIEESAPSVRPAAYQPRDRLSIPSDGATTGPALIPLAARSTPVGVRPADRTTPPATPAAASASVNASLPSQDARQETSPVTVWDGFIDELNERLEQAAADLGIDLEE